MHTRLQPSAEVLAVKVARQRWRERGSCFCPLTYYGARWHMNEDRARLLLHLGPFVQSGKANGVGLILCEAKSEREMREREAQRETMTHPASSHFFDRRT